MLNWRDPKNPQSGGAERVTEGYLTALAERGHEVVWFANSFPGCLPEERWGRLTVRRGGGVGKSFLAARAWCRTQPRFDLVIDQHHGIPWYTPWWAQTSRVSYIHEVLGPIWNAFYRWPWNWIGRQQERWTHWLYRKEVFWTACESTRDQLMRHGVRQVKIIRYGVHTRALEELDPKPLQVPLRLAAVSRLAPNKRVDHLIRTLALLHDRGVAARLTIVGSGDAEPALRQMVKERNLEAMVEFTGPLSEAAKDQMLRASHWLLHASQREGWGLNVIEANAMGTPAAVYPVEGLRESTLDERTGVLARAETPEALADRLAECLQHPERYQAYRRQAWERAQSMHWSRILPEACDWLEARARGEKVL